jgi:hypothetical protein
LPGPTRICVLLRPDRLLLAFLAAADDLVGDVEDVDLDPLDVVRPQPVPFAQLEHCLERRLRVDLGDPKIPPGRPSGESPFSSLRRGGSRMRVRSSPGQGMVAIAELARYGRAATGC